MSRRGRRIEPIGERIVRYALAGVIGTIGALKFTDYEAKNIESLVEHSPLTAWLRRCIGMKSAGPWRPRSAAGSLWGCSVRR
jgi:uncharacterized membrane protein YkgB